ncbi:MAG: hypothetical protein M0015_03030 [Betaproteobacteria bacterium]|nr:hypothetical protein [Betaproteobacteria bacterium]
MRALARALGETNWTINDICDGCWTKQWEPRDGILSGSWRARAR